MHVLAGLSVAASLAFAVRPAGASGHAWEWAGIFTLEEEVYTWSAVRSEHSDHDDHDHGDHDDHDHGDHDDHDHGDHGDHDHGEHVEQVHSEDGEHIHPHMRLVIYPVAVADHDGLHEVDAQAEQLWEGEVLELDADNAGVLSLDASGVAVELEFSTLGWISLFHINVTQKGSYAFFCEHPPMEFESGFHFFKDDHGTDVEPVYVDNHHEDPPEPESPSTLSLLALAVGGAFLTTAPSTLLILLLGPSLAKIGPSIISRFTPAASGAISGTAVFLILPEAWELLGAGDENSSGTRTWGIALLLGWLFSVATHHAVSLFSPVDQHNTGVSLLASQSSKVLEIEGEAGAQSAAVEATSLAVAVPVLLGDAIHGVVDGVVIGLAARTCGAALTWSIVIATLGHETPQEIGAFLVLVTEAKMSWTRAMLWNFLAGQAAVPGAIAGFFLDFSAWSQGILLGAGGGIFLFVGFSELLPQILHLRQKSLLESLLVLGSFVLGAALISLFVGHVHCSAEGHDHGHDGHDH